jgi:hypothetical protein
MNPNEWKDVLRSAHNEPIDAAHYTAVRSRVIAEIERSHTPWRRLAWISGVAALMAAVLFMIALRRPDIAPPPLVAIAIPPPPESPRPAPMRVRQRTAAVHHEPITIKLQTSDPNIVIYWIAD